MYEVLSSTVFFFVSYMHTHTCPVYNILLEVVCCCFPNCLHILLNMILFVGSHSYIFPLSFMHVSAVVSEIHELNQNKKKKKKEKNSEIPI